MAPHSAPVCDDASTKKRCSTRYSARWSLRRRQRTRPLSTTARSAPARRDSDQLRHSGRLW